MEIEIIETSDSQFLQQIYKFRFEVFVSDNYIKRDLNLIFG